MLVVLLDHYTLQIQDCKKDAVRLAGSGGFKMVLALLAKAIIVQIEIFII